MPKRPLDRLRTICLALPEAEERETWDSYVHVPDGSRSIVKDGHITLPDAPGIGIALDMAGVRKHAVPGYGIFE